MENVTNQFLALILILFQRDWNVNCWWISVELNYWGRTQIWRRKKTCASRIVRILKKKTPRTQFSSVWNQPIAFLMFSLLSLSSSKQKLPFLLQDLSSSPGIDPATFQLIEQPSAYWATAIEIKPLEGKLKSVTCVSKIHFPAFALQWLLQYKRERKIPNLTELWKHFEYFLSWSNYRRF